MNHLLYVDDLKLPGKTKVLNHYYRQSKLSADIGMASGPEKCASLIIKRGEIVQSDGITLPDNKMIRNLQENESCNCQVFKS